MSSKRNDGRSPSQRLKVKHLSPSDIRRREARKIARVGMPNQALIMQISRSVEVAEVEIYEAEEPVVYPADWVQKYVFDFYYGTRRNPTIVRSGAIGADNRDAAMHMARRLNPLEASDPRISITVEEAVGMKWPRTIA